MREMKLGRHLSLQDFCECTQTYRAFADQVDPYPKESASLNALSLLASEVLDPIIDHYGRESFLLTYGFCSNELRRKLVSKNPATGKPFGRVAPKLDQHSALETVDGVSLFCARGGSAADFRIVGQDSRSVMDWIVTQALPFDRMYFYGSDRSIHISHGPEHSRYICGFSEKNLPERKSVRELVALAKEVYGR